MKQVGRNDLLNGWLKFHNTTVDELAVTLPEELKDSPEWWAMYAVTQEQHDEWVEWAKDFVKKETRKIMLYMCFSKLLICTILIKV